MCGLAFPVTTFRTLCGAQAVAATGGCASAGNVMTCGPVVSRD